MNSITTVNKFLLLAVVACFGTSAQAEKKACAWTFESISKGKHFDDVDPSDKLMVENAFRKISDDPKYRPSVTEELYIRKFGLWDAIPEYRKLAQNKVNRHVFHSRLT